MYSLYLFERHVSHTLHTLDTIIEYLLAIKFIKTQGSAYISDLEFAYQINFLGCSPNVGDENPHLVQFKSFDTVQGVGGDSINVIQCPKCKNKINAPQEILLNQSQVYDCPKCEQETHSTEINWRKSAGFSKSFIQIHNIFPKEALPNNQFLNSLNAINQTTWCYFYSKSQQW
ncbi:MAG: hypothetical protein ISR69_13315 [Gammaproteobacteria bacterium]|nr:hypothetical protein [Gammaproteobacteria bacterium]